MEQRKRHLVLHSITFIINGNIYSFDFDSIEPMRSSSERINRIKSLIHNRNVTNVEAIDTSLEWDLDLNLNPQYFYDTDYNDEKIFSL